MTTLAAALLGLGLACACAPKGAARARRDAPIPACDGAPEAAPRLESYLDAAPGARFHLDVTWDARAGWAPAAFIAMPHHHSSRIEWANLAEWPRLDELRAERLRFRFVLGETKIEKVPGEHRWWATYPATIEGVCKTDR